jgi:hypothetical protein
MQGVKRKTGIGVSDPMLRIVRGVEPRDRFPPGAHQVRHVREWGAIPRRMQGRSWRLEKKTEIRGSDPMLRIGEGWNRETGSLQARTK